LADIVALALEFDKPNRCCYSKFLFLVFRKVWISKGNVLEDYNLSELKKRLEEIEVKLGDLGRHL